MDPNNDYCDLMGDNPNIYESIDAVVYQNNPIKVSIEPFLCINVSQTVMP